MTLRSIVRTAIATAILAALLAPAVPAATAEAATTYKITYSANGGKGAPAAQTKKKNVALKLSTKKPTRATYTFKGWATSASASKAAYQPGDTVKANRALKLYAVWHLNYIALGDSYSSGEGAVPDKGATQFLQDKSFGWTTACHRSPNAYAKVLDRQLSLELKDFRACTGATTDDVISRAQKVGGKTVARKQVDYLGSTTGLVTITIGGNDARFADTIKLCGSADFGCYPASPTVRDALERLGAASLSADLRQTYTRILTKASKAKLVVIGYPDFLPGKDASGADKPICGYLSRSDPDPRTQDDMNRNITKGIRTLITKLNSVVKTSVSSVAKTYPGRIYFVPTTSGGDPFKGHDLCATVPFVNDPLLTPVKDLAYAFHPNVSGQMAYYRNASTFIKAKGYAK